eukprot:COSAG06_NODE_8204_length_2239_cov_2.454673_4_plen_100_part_00
MPKMVELVSECGLPMQIDHRADRTASLAQQRGRISCCCARQPFYIGFKVARRNLLDRLHLSHAYSAEPRTVDVCAAPRRLTSGARSPSAASREGSAETH